MSRQRSALAKVQAPRGSAGTGSGPQPGARGVKSPSVRPERVKIRVLGTSVTLLESIRRQASRDLGIEVSFDVHDGTAAQRLGVVHPDKYDVYDQWFHNVDFVWPARAIRPIDHSRITLWAEVSDLAKTGRVVPGAPIGAGSAPVHRLYVQPNGMLGSQSSAHICMLPTVYNVDSFGYRTDVIPRGKPYQTESWSWLLDPAWSGKVALQSDAAIGAIDAALALSASGAAQFRDIGNLTIDEIDLLVSTLMERRRDGHFRAFWANHREAATLMQSGKVAVSSLWSPAHAALRQAGVPVAMASPREGYRGWYGGLSLSARTSGRELDAAYDYLNWWLMGWAGSVVTRHGYYVSVPSRARQYLSDAEWDYWYEGLPAPTDLPGPDGVTAVREGEVRDGGSHVERVSRIAVWNSVMDEHNYLVRRWSELMRPRR